MIKKKFLKSKPVCKATFSVSKDLANGADTAVLVGEFNEWNVENAVSMKKLKSGVFKATVDLEAGKEYEFRYLFDNERWENDEEADKYVASPFGVENSVVSALN